MTPEQERALALARARRRRAEAEATPSDPTLSRDELPQFGVEPSQESIAKGQAIAREQNNNRFSREIRNIGNMIPDFTAPAARQEFLEEQGLPSHNRMGDLMGGVINFPANVAETALALGDSVQNPVRRAVGARELNSAQTFNEAVPRYTPEEGDDAGKLITTLGETVPGMASGVGAYRGLVGAGVSPTVAAGAGYVGGEGLMAAGMSPDVNPAFIGENAEIMPISGGVGEGVEGDYSSQLAHRKANLALEGLATGGVLAGAGYLTKQVGGLLNDSVVGPLARMFSKTSQENLAAEPIIETLRDLHPGLRGSDTSKIADFVNEAVQRHGKVEIGGEVLSRDTISALELALKADGQDNEVLIQALRDIRRGSMGTDSPGLSVAIDAPNKMRERQLEQTRLALGGDETMKQSSSNITRGAQERVGEAEARVAGAVDLERQASLTGDELLRSDPLFSRSAGKEVDVNLLTEPENIVRDITESVTREFEEATSLFRSTLDEIKPNSKIGNVKGYQEVRKRVLEDPDIPESIKTSLVDAGNSYKNIYGSVPEINSWIRSISDNARPNFEDQIAKLRDLTRYVTANPSKGAGQRAAQMYTDQIAPLTRDGPVGKVYGTYTDTLNRSRGGQTYANREGIGRYTFEEEANQTVRNSLNNPFSNQVVDVMMKRGEGDKVVDYVVADLARALMGSGANAGRRVGDLVDSVAVGEILSRAEKLMPTLERAAPDQVQRLGDFVNKVRNSQGNLANIRSDIETFAKEASRLEDEVYGDVYKNFFRDKNIPASDSFDSFKSLFGDVKGGRRKIDTIVNSVLDSGDEVTIQGMQSGYMKFLTDKLDTVSGDMSKKTWKEIDRELKPYLEHGDIVFKNSPETMKTVRELIDESGRILDSRGAKPLLTDSWDIASKGKSAVGTVITFTLGVLNRAAARARIGSSAAIGSLDPNRSFLNIRDAMLADADEFARIINQHPISKGKLPLPVKRYMTNLLIKNSTLGERDIQTLMAEEEGAEEAVE